MWYTCGPGSAKTDDHSCWPKYIPNHKHNSDCMMCYCRYVQYYADWLQQPNLLPRRLQLQRVTVTGIPLSDLRNLVVGVWVRPPGAGWKTELVCLAAVKPEAQYLAGVSLLPASNQSMWTSVPEQEFCASTCHTCHICCRHVLCAAPTCYHT